MPPSLVSKWFSRHRTAPDMRCTDSQAAPRISIVPITRLELLLLAGVVAFSWTTTVLTVANCEWECESCASTLLVSEILSRIQIMNFREPVTARRRSVAVPNSIGIAEKNTRNDSIGWSLTNKGKAQVSRTKQDS